MTEAQVGITSVLRRYCVGAVEAKANLRPLRHLSMSVAIWLSVTGSVSASSSSEPWAAFWEYCFLPLDGQTEFNTADLRPVLNSYREYTDETGREARTKSWTKKEWNFHLTFARNSRDVVKACGMHAPHEWIHPVLSDFESFSSDNSDRFEALDDDGKANLRPLGRRWSPRKAVVDKDWRERTIAVKMMHDLNTISLVAWLVERKN